MKVEVFPDTQSAGRAAAREVAAYLRGKPDAVLGLATGHTMIPVYGELVRLHEEEGLSLAGLTTFNLDEYAGLGRGDMDSCYEFMMKRLVVQTDLNEDRFHVPDGKAPDLAAESERYESMIRESGGIDLQLLGLGRNGHIGFNEPGSTPGSRTRVVELSRKTREVNAGDFRLADGTPTRGLTMGVATILEARSIIIVVTGWEKSGILHQVLTRPSTPEVPATHLHTHKDAILIADEEAMETYFENVRTGRSFEAAPAVEIRELDLEDDPPGRG